MPKILEQLKAETFLPHPESGGLFCLADDGLIYMVSGPTSSYGIGRFQPIRSGLSFFEVVTWEQFVRTGHENPLGPRLGSLTFRSIKKAIEALEAGKVAWVPSPYFRTDADRQDAYSQRSAEDYLPSKLRWALAKEKGETWACQKAGVPTLEQPWKTRVCELLPLLPRD
jgi:hypothetical protein